ncbi:MAG: nitroreductase family protein [Clostridiales bacterium]|jgi:nitroreductase|nr:nitroreductase family protein [Bacillota bacterium]NLK04366.1 nitroreductase family protein [Clostridiales bacterium]
MDIINLRRSIRRYKDQPVEQEKIEKLLRAAMQAPSAANQQPWEFIVVQDEKYLKKLSEISAYSKMVAEAPLAIVLIGNEDRMRLKLHWEQDMAAATQNILLESAYLGLGAVWLGVAPMEDRMKLISEIFGLKDRLKPFCVIPIGYPGEGQENKFVDRFDSSRIHYETYNS